MNQEKVKLLIVEDDPNLGQILKDYLEVKGYHPVLCENGEEGLKVFRKHPFGFCILDIMLPKKDGFSLAKDIRHLDAHIPIIFLTAKSLKQDVIEGLKIGADDYITKPFSMEELLLRIQAILRRTSENGLHGGTQNIYEFGHCFFDYNQQILTTPVKKSKLTSKESDLLKLLCQSINQTLDRSKALKLIWGDDTYFNARSMDVYINKLRKLLKQDPQIQILTIHGQGFKLVNIN